LEQGKTASERKAGLYYRRSGHYDAKGQGFSLFTEYSHRKGKVDMGHERQMIEPFRKGGNREMKRISVLLFIFVTAHMLFAFTAFADPRMETNNNFCHFILNADNTVNEVFLAGCDAVITVVEKVAAAVNTQTNCTEQNYVASGYAVVTKEMPLAAALLAPNNTLRFTSNDSAVPCTMVESNGRAYKSNKWRSSIKLGRPNRNSIVTVYYELFCQDGQQ
jgi:hypothetical protein